MSNCYIKFYADTSAGERNKYFCFKLKSILSLHDSILRFYCKGFNIRSAWYQETNLETGEVINQRIPAETLNELFEEYVNLTPKQKKLYC